MHGIADSFPVPKDLRQILTSNHIAERCLSEQSRRGLGVTDISNRDGCIVDSKVDHGVYGDCYTVFSENLGRNKHEMIIGKQD